MSELNPLTSYDKIRQFLIHEVTDKLVTTADDYVQKVWKEYSITYYLYDLRYTAYEDWPKGVKRSYENWQYQSYLNDLCEVDLSTYGTSLFGPSCRPACQWEKYNS